MAIKTFPYAVIYEGKLYTANTPIKVKDQETDKKPTKKAVTKNDKGTGRKA